MQQARADRTEQRNNDGQLLTREEANDAGDRDDRWRTATTRKEKKCSKQRRKEERNLAQ